MKQLYDLGYQSVKLENIQALVAKLDAALFDIRYSPRSSDPQWLKDNLEKAIPSYQHVQNLGNKLYKGNTIQFVDIDAGCDLIAKTLEERPVILMCSCWSRTTCHRYELVKVFALRYGIESIPILSNKIAREIISGKVESPPPEQEKLF